MAGSSGMIIIMLMLAVFVCFGAAGVAYYEGWTCSAGFGNNCSSSSPAPATPDTTGSSGSTGSTTTTPTGASLYTEYGGTYNSMDGFDDGTPAATTVDDCANACTSTSGCTTFKFTSTSTGLGGVYGSTQCALKKSVNPANNYGDGGIWIENIPGYTMVPPPNNNIDGNDIQQGSTYTTLKTCAQGCTSTSGCNSIIYNETGIGGAYGTTAKCAFKSTNSATNQLGNSIMWTKN